MDATAWSCSLTVSLPRLTGSLTSLRSRDRTSLPEASTFSKPPPASPTAERRVIADRIVALERPGRLAHKGAVLLGVLVGLFAAQFEND